MGMQWLSSSSITSGSAHSSWARGYAWARVQVCRHCSSKLAHGCQFIRERYRDLVFLRFVLVRFEIIEDCLRISSSFLFWPNVLCFMIIALPLLNDTVASLSESSCVKKALSLVFPCSTILCLSFGNHFIHPCQWQPCYCWFSVSRNSK